MKIYQSYMFRSKDPVIDELRTLTEDVMGERLSFQHFKSLEANGGPAFTTSRSWFFGKTKRPQSATVEAYGRAMGYRRKWVKLNGAHPGTKKDRTA